MRNTFRSPQLASALLQLSHRAANSLTRTQLIACFPAEGQAIVAHHTVLLSLAGWSWMARSGGQRHMRMCAAVIMEDTRHLHRLWSNLVPKAVWSLVCPFSKLPLTHRPWLLCKPDRRRLQHSHSPQGLNNYQQCPRQHRQSQLAVPRPL